MTDEEETHSQAFANWEGPRNPQLIAIWDGGSSSLSLPAEGELTIGRSQACDLRIAHPSVSREHARILAGDRLVLVELGSSNGTRVNGRTLAAGERIGVGPGQLIELGSTMLLVQEPGHQPLSMLAAGTESAPLSDMERLHRLVDLVATSTISVILQGETGVGKEVFARRIHENSPRSSGPYLRINCAAFAESMVEAELFGYEKGAFTGAQQAKAGLLEAARGGTVLLDEVGELTPFMQVKLLRAIGNREVLRVGALQPRPVDVRFIAATNRDFQQLIERGSFRADLFYRLNGITIRVPPLRERRGEILPLASEFIREEAQRLAVAAPPLSAAAQQALLQYGFPGNVRELKSILERATLLSQGGPIGVEHLAMETQVMDRGPLPRTPPRMVVPQPQGVPELRKQMDELERQGILQAIAECAGNQTKASRLLGISRRALLNRLDRYNVPRPRKNR